MAERDYTIIGPDGREVTITGPDNATPQQLRAAAARAFAAAPVKPANTKGAERQAEIGESFKRIANIVPGAIRGAGSIGATLLRPFESAEENKRRRAEIDIGLMELVGADPQNVGYSLGKLGGEIAGTAGAGPAIASAARAVPVVSAAAPNLLQAIRTGGMSAGAAAPGIVGGAQNALVRAAGGAVTGGASAGLVDPELAKTGAVIGGALPVGTKVAGELGRGTAAAWSAATEAASKRLMQSAIKPTIKQLQTGEADIAVQTLLEYGINPNKAGVEKLRALINAKNAEIASEIANSGATIDKQNVLNALGGVRAKFGNQVSPTADLNAIQGVADDFAAHPNLPGSSIPVQAAQEMKQGTYKVLSKKYGQLGSADIEAQKALARGLKDEIATAVPAVGPLNAEESRLLTTLSVAERRALMEMNKNPMGLASLASNPISWAAFMADKSALFKSLAARALNSMAPAATGQPNAIQRLLANQPAQQLGYRAAPVALDGQ